MICFLNIIHVATCIHWFRRSELPRRCSSFSGIRLFLWVYSLQHPLFVLKASYSTRLFVCPWPPYDTYVVSPKRWLERSRMSDTFLRARTVTYSCLSLLLYVHVAQRGVERPSGSKFNWVREIRCPLEVVETKCWSWRGKLYSEFLYKLSGWGHMGSRV